MGGGFCLLTIGKFQILRRLVGFPAIDGSSPVPVLENLAENIADVDRILRGRIEREMEFQKKAAPLPLDKLL
jgi:hypothetical protein